MAIISVTATDLGQVTQHWDIPAEQDLNRSPIPRGVRIYRGSTAIAALGSGDETSVAITHSFPLPYVYLLKNIEIEFESDDLTTEFSNQGLMEYNPSGTTAPKTVYGLSCDGPAFRLALRSVQVYRPMGTFRQWINGPRGDIIRYMLADISGDTSTAGDVLWYAEYWEFDVEQCLRWQVNTPIPTYGF